MESKITIEVFCSDNISQIRSTFVSAMTSNLSSGRPNRLARMATCDSDSSPVIYKTD